MTSGTKAGSLFWRLSLDNAAFKRALRGTEERVRAMGRRVRSIATAIGKAFAVAFSIAGGAAIKFASDAEEAANVFNETFKGRAKEVGDELDGFAKAANRSRFELRKTAGSLQALLGPMGFTLDESSKMSVAFTKLGTDLSSFFNVSESDALMALRAGIVGEAEPLRRLGVQINQAKIEQEALNAGWIRSKKELTPLIKTQAIFNIVMRETQQVQGDAINTAGSFENQMRGMWAAIKDLLTEAAKPLLPVLADLLGQFRDMLPAAGDAKAAGERLATILKSLVPIIVETTRLTIKLITYVREVWIGAFTAMADTALRFYRWFSSSTDATMMNFKDAIVDGLKTTVYAFMNWKELAALALLTVVKKLVDLGDAFDSILSFVGDTIGTFATNMYFKFKNGFENVITLFKNFATNAKMIFSALWDSLAQGSTRPLEDLFMNGFKALDDGFKKGVDSIPLPEYVGKESKLAKDLEKEIHAINERLGEKMFDFNFGGKNPTLKINSVEIPALKLPEFSGGGGTDTPDQNKDTQKEKDRVSFTGIAEAFRNVQQNVFNNKEKKRDQLAEKRTRSLFELTAHSKTMKDYLGTLVQAATTSPSGLAP